MVYLDNAATTKPCAECCKAVAKAAAERFGNPGSLHKMGILSEQIISSAKRTILNALGGGALRRVRLSSHRERPKAIIPLYLARRRNIPETAERL